MGVSFKGGYPIMTRNVNVNSVCGQDELAQSLIFAPPWSNGGTNPVKEASKVISFDLIIMIEEKK
jgi:hypothetical protein